MLLVGGGTGLAPLKSIVRHVIENDLRRRRTLYWGVRSERDLYAQGELKELVRHAPAFRYEAVLSEPSAAWAGRRRWAPRRHFARLSGSQSARHLRERPPRHDRRRARRICTARCRSCTTVFRLVRLCSGYTRAPAPEGRDQSLTLGRSRPRARAPPAAFAQRLSPPAAGHQPMDMVEVAAQG